MSIYRIKMNGKTYEMEIELLEEGKPKKSQKAQESHEQRVQPEIEHKEKAVQKMLEINSNTVTSPMPGSIVQIMVNEGDKVCENDVILILEAMKMENEVCASKAGKIKSIFVNIGQAVTSGDPLFELEG